MPFGRVLGTLAGLSLDLIRSMWRGVRWVWVWLWGLDLLYDNGSGVVRDVATLYGFVVTYGIALTVTLSQGISEKPTALFIYILISFLTITMMVAVLRTRAALNVSAHAFDRGSIVFTRLTIVASLITVATFVTLASAGLLPTTNFSVPKKATLGAPHRLAFGEKEPAGIEIPVTLSKDMYAEGLPPKLFMVVELGEDLGGKWQVDAVEGYLGWEPRLTEMKTPPTQYVEKRDGPERHSVWILRDLDKSAIYTIKVVLRSKKEESVDGAMKSIKANEGVKVTFYSREK
jgi:hypothetical protein